MNYIPRISIENERLSERCSMSATAELRAPSGLAGSRRRQGALFKTALARAQAGAATHELSPRSGVGAAIARLAAAERAAQEGRELMAGEHPGGRGDDHVR